MEPVWHVVKEIWDQDEKCVGSEVISTYDGDDRETFKAAAAEAREMQEAYDEDPDDPPSVTYSVSMW